MKKLRTAVTVLSDRLFFFFSFKEDLDWMVCPLWERGWGKWMCFVGKMYPSDRTCPDLDYSVCDLPVCHGPHCRLWTKDHVLQRISEHSLEKRHSYFVYTVMIFCKVLFATIFICDVMCE